MAWVRAERGGKKSLKDILHLHNSPEFLRRALTLFQTRFCEFLPKSLSMLLWSIRAPCRVPTFSANKSKSLEKFANPMTKGDLDQIQMCLLGHVLSLLVYGSPLARQYFISFSFEHEFAIWALRHNTQAYTRRRTRGKPLERGGGDRESCHNLRLIPPSP